MKWPACVYLVFALGAMSPAQVADGSSAKPAFRISGTVVNAQTGDPVPGAIVNIAAVTMRSTSRTTSADTTGHFAFENVGPAKYSLSARAKGFPEQAFDEHQGFATAIAVGPNLVSEGLAFRLQPEAAITGTVTDDFNEPVRNGDVMLFRQGHENGTPGTFMVGQSGLDDQGTFSFGHLRAGTYFVAVSARPWFAVEPSSPPVTFFGAHGSASNRNSSPPPIDTSLDVVYPVTYYDGATDSGSATPIALAPGERTTADITLKSLPSVHLRIQTPPVPQSGIASPEQRGFVNASLKQRILGDHELPMPVRIWRPSPDSPLTVDGVAPGHYILTLESTEGKKQTSRNLEVDLSADSEIDAQEVPPRPSVTGKYCSREPGPKSHSSCS